MHDLLIVGASLYDGSGAPARAADLAVHNGCIAAIGHDLGAAHETIDGAGLALMPGIIDTHTHYDAQLTWDPYVRPSPAMGVTSVVIGNCGFTIAPCRPQDRDLVMRNLTHVEGMSLDALRSGINWQFESFPEYLAALEANGVGPNVAAFVGHSSVRTFIMGPDATERAATPEEIERMRQLVLEAMRAGAVGFSSTTSLQHNGENGIPMPSRLADEVELTTLVGSLREVGRGMFMLTKAESTRVPFLEKLAVASGRPVLVAALLHNPLTPDAALDDLDHIGAANERGNRMYGAVSCTPLNFEFSFHEPYPLEGLAVWQPAMRAGHDGLRAFLAAADFRAGVKEELSVPKRRMFTGDWALMHVAKVANPAHLHYEGKTLMQLGQETGKHPLDFMLDLALAEDLDTVFTATLLNYDEDAIAKLLRHPHSVVSLSDAGAHLTFLCDAGFGLHLLGHWSRDKGVLPIEQAVKKLTSECADAFGIQGRGRLEVGAHADLLLFDPATVGRGRASRVHDLPAHASRLDTPAHGVHGVWINGVRIADGQGLIANAPLSGQVMRQFNA